MTMNLSQKNPSFGGNPTGFLTGSPTRQGTNLQTQTPVLGQTGSPSQKQNPPQFVQQPAPSLNSTMRMSSQNNNSLDKSSNKSVAGDPSLKEYSQNSNNYSQYDLMGLL